MTPQESLQHIYEALEHDAGLAQEMIQQHRQHYGESPEACIAEGKLHLKRSDWRMAQNAFLKAQESQPHGAASEYLSMLADIMAFYNKDMYNQ